MRRSLLPALLLVACSSPSRTPTSPPGPQGTASADLKLNAQKTGTFDCAGGLFFVTSVSNQTTAPLSVSGLSLNFTRVSGDGCASHAAPIEPALSLSVPMGISAEVRRVDLAGDLCSPPSGAPGCEWLAKATISTSFGTLTDEIGFRTAAAPASNRAPRISSIAIAGQYGVAKDRLDLAFTVTDPDGDSVNWTAALSVPDRPGWLIGRLAPTDHCGNGSGRANAASTRVTGVARNGRASLCVYYTSPGGAAGSYNVLTVTADDGHDEAEPQTIRVLAF